MYNISLTARGQLSVIYEVFHEKNQIKSDQIKKMYLIFKKFRICEMIGLDCDFRWKIEIETK